MITTEDIEKLAKLSRLKLTDAEKSKYAKDMENILAYVKQIDEVTAAPEMPTSSLGRFAKTPRSPLDISGAAESPRNVMRSDDMPHEPGIFTDELLKLAPRSEKNRVKVKKIL